jgi:hypothetical protein
MALRDPDFQLSMRVAAMFARISPFLLQGLKGVSSVIGPLTFPYMYALSKKMSFAPARLQASMELLITRGHISSHTL